MIDLGPHAFYIITAYGGVGITIALLIVATVLDARRQNTRLAMLENQTPNIPSSSGQSK